MVYIANSRRVRDDIYGGSFISGCDKFAEPGVDWYDTDPPSYQHNSSANANLATWKAAGYDVIEIRTWIYLPNFFNYIEPFLVKADAAGIKVMLNIETAINYSYLAYGKTVPPDAHDECDTDYYGAGPPPTPCPNYLSAVAYYEDWPLPVTPLCDHYRYAVEFNGDRTTYQGGYDGAAEYELDTLGDVITAANADPRICGYSTEGSFMNGVHWLSDRAHEAGKEFIYYLNAEVFCVDPDGLPHYPTDWGDCGLMQKGTIGTWVSYCDAIIPEIYAPNAVKYLYAAWGEVPRYGDGYGTEGVAIVDTIEYLRANHPTLPIGLISNTYPTQTSFWADTSATAWTPGTPSSTSMGRDGYHEGYYDADGILERSRYWLLAQRAALGGKADFQVVSMQALSYKASVSEQIAEIESLNLLGDSTKVSKTLKFG